MPAAGWYPDPDGVVRWWDGERWTEHVQPASLPAAPSAPPATVAADDPEPARSAGRHAPLLVGGLVMALLVVAGLVVGVLLLTGGDDDPVASDPAPTPTGPTADPTSEPTTQPTTEPTPTETPTATESPEPTVPVLPGPDQVAEGFMAAVVAVDCPAAEALSTPDFLQRSGGCADDDADPDALAGASYDVQEPVVDAGSATVDVVLTVLDDDGTELPPFTFTLRLVETSEGWLVDDLAEQS